MVTKRQAGSFENWWGMVMAFRGQYVLMNGDVVSGVGQAKSQISFHLHQDRETPFPNEIFGPVEELLAEAGVCSLCGSPPWPCDGEHLEICSRVQGASTSKSTYTTCVRKALEVLDSLRSEPTGRGIDVWSQMLNNEVEITSVEAAASSPNFLLEDRRLLLEDIACTYLYLIKFAKVAENPGGNITASQSDEGKHLMLKMPAISERR
ncbi:hypothetical protein DNTS_016629 [Danionella cerebrum]|uniref:Uncharacterized protein n=1 Tax=Danionella cerebrum TaxID=2873325 RepID=A0A553R8H0_9TELE|nr:hypothetical protein DNTS_016629 [Danionella translucida]